MLPVEQGDLLGRKAHAVGVGQERLHRLQRGHHEGTLGRDARGFQRQCLAPRRCERRLGAHGDDRGVIGVGTDQAGAIGQDFFGEIGVDRPEKAVAPVEETQAQRAGISDEAGEPTRAQIPARPPRPDQTPAQIRLPARKPAGARRYMCR